EHPLEVAVREARAEQERIEVALVVRAQNERARRREAVEPAGAQPDAEARREPEEPREHEEPERRDGAVTEERSDRRILRGRIGEELVPRGRRAGGFPRGRFTQSLDEVAHGVDPMRYLVLDLDTGRLLQPHDE